MKFPQGGQPSSCAIPAIVPPRTHGPLQSPPPHRPAVERPVGAERRVPVISLERATSQDRHRFGGAGQNLEPVRLWPKVDHVSPGVPASCFGHRGRLLSPGEYVIRAQCLFSHEASDPLTKISNLPLR